MNEITILIHCFGAFRKFGDKISITVNGGSSVQNIKDALVQTLGQEHKDLIEDSVLANDNEILPNVYVIAEETELLILPPVCGG